MFCGHCTRRLYLSSIKFLQLWPVIYSVNKADDCRSQSHGREKYKLQEKAFSEILVDDTTSEAGAEASDVEVQFEEEEEKEQQQQQQTPDVAITNTG